jgi:DNA-binding Lrp family transcriptional regulator
MPELDVVDRLARLKDSGIVREFSAIFDARRLGYESTLVAARYKPSDLEHAARAISQNPGVSHNYERDHAFNLWYTLAVPPGVDIAATVDSLHRATGAESTRMLPSLRVFKIGVHLDLSDTPSAARQTEPLAEAPPPGEAAGCSPSEMRAVRALQDDLPATRFPFEQTAAREGFAAAGELLDVAKRMEERGALRRLAVVLRHRKAGFSANGMVAWNVPVDRCEVTGRLMATFRQVSHCYQRPPYPDWPYSLFTMIHGASRAEVEDCVAAIAGKADSYDHRILYSLREFKKERVRYFVE